MVIWLKVKTTLELPDELISAAKIRAAIEGRRLKDVVADLLRRGLAEEPKRPRPVQRKVRLPLVQCAHDARREREMTPNRVAEVLAREDVKAVRQPS
jgi:plasmid stability protein